MNLSTLVLTGLAVVWAIVLAPAALRRLSDLRRVDPVNSFHRQMSSLHRPGPGRPSPGRPATAGRPSASARPGAHGARRPGAAAGRNVIDLRTHAAARPRVSAAARKRRQDVLVMLAAAALLTLVCTVAFGGAFLLLHLLADALLVAYVVLLNRTAQAPVRSRQTLAPRYGAPIDLRSSRPAPVSARRAVY